MSRASWTFCAVAGLLVLQAGTLGFGGQESRTARPDAGSLLDRFLTRQAPQLRQYSALRRLEARNLRFKAEGWLEVRTWLDPERGFGYEVVREGGSGYIRRRVLRAALEAESKAVSSGDAARSALTTENYAFTPARPAGDGTQVLRLAARRRDKFLVNGSLFLSEPDADLVRMEAVPAKNPSFWTSRVEITRTYQRVNGVRVPVTLGSTAWVKIAGRSEFLMTYQYESVNGLPVVPPGSTGAAADAPGRAGSSRNRRL